MLSLGGGSHDFLSTILNGRPIILENHMKMNLILIDPQP